MPWLPIENSDGHIWEINEETQEFRLDGQIVPGGAGLAEMLKQIWGFDITPTQATEIFKNWLAFRIPPGSGKTSQ